MSSVPGPVTALATRMWNGTGAAEAPLRPSTSGPAPAPQGGGQQLRVSPTKVRDNDPVFEHFYQDEICRVTAILTFANVVTIETPDGLVMVDGGSPQTAPQALRSIRKYTNQHLNTCVYTHGWVSGRDADDGRGSKREEEGKEGPSNHVSISAPPFLPDTSTTSGALPNSKKSPAATPPNAPPSLPTKTYLLALPATT